MKNQSRGKPTQLGSLESDVIRTVWEKGEASVKDVKDALEPKRPLAYTTVMTVMSRQSCAILDWA